MYFPVAVENNMVSYIRVPSRYSMLSHLYQPLVPGAAFAQNVEFELEDADGVTDDVDLHCFDLRPSVKLLKFNIGMYLPFFHFSLAFVTSFFFFFFFSDAFFLVCYSLLFFRKFAANECVCVCFLSIHAFQIFFQLMRCTKSTIVRFFFACV